MQNRQLPASVVNIEMGAMLSETIERRASLGTSHGERTMTGEEREEEEKQSNGKMQREPRNAR